MNSADKQYISHSFMVSEISGSGGLCNISTAMVPDYRIPYFIGYNEENKSAVTIEQLFVPVASNSGNAYDLGNLPYCNNDGIIDTSQIRLSDRFQYGIIATINSSGSLNPPSGSIGPLQSVVHSISHALPMYGTGFGFDVKNNFIPTTYVAIASGISNTSGLLGLTFLNHGFSSGDSIVMNGLYSSGVNYNNTFTIADVTDRNIFTVNVPVASGTVPSGTPYFYPASNNPPTDPYPGRTQNLIDKIQDVQSWKAGPVDLRWDDTRRVWCGSDFFRNDIIRGYLSSDIIPALGRNRPSTFTMKTYKPNVKPTYINSIGGSTPTLTDSNQYLQLTMDSDSPYFEVGQAFNVVNNNDFPQYNTRHMISKVVGLIITTKTIYSGIPNATPTSWIMPTSDLSTISFKVDKEYTINNYDKHLSIQLNSACDETVDGCSQKENDIRVIALRVSATELESIYVGF